MVLVVAALVGRVQPQPPVVLGRAGYALDFNAPQSAQWQESGPSITFSSQTCTDPESGCICCEPGALSLVVSRACL